MSLPPDGRRALDRKLSQLERDPRHEATYSRTKDRWTSSFGQWGVLEYIVQDAVVRVVVLRVTWIA